MSDLVVNVRQVSSYPLTTPVPPNANLLLQSGLGSPYISASASALVSTALISGPALGVGYPVPADANPTQIFTGNHVLLPQWGIGFNTYATAMGNKNWQSGYYGAIDMDGPNGAFRWTLGAGSAGQASLLTPQMYLSQAGALSLPNGTLTVARDPGAALEVATMGYVGAHTVASFNGRNGVVQLSSSDIYQALCLDSAIATQQWVCNQLNAAFAAMLEGTVVRWNNRSGNVYLMLSDITCVFFQSGQQPITPTPVATSDDYSIANTAWVTQYVADTLSGGTGGLGLATEAWVQANTVASFNGRIGAVTLALSDITAAGGAPQQSPQLLGIPTAPTQAVGNASSAIATTAFVWNAVQESTTGVVSWNGRTGVVTLDATDINDAGGALLNSPAFTGVPTAATAPTGTTTTQLATCAFVLNEVQAIGAGVTTFNTRSGNVVLELADIEGAGGAPIADPAFSGNPTCPTPASPVAATTSIANTNWVVQYNALNTVASFNSRIGAVTLNANDITAAGGLANPNVALTGAPTAPTLVPGTSTTGIATTAFVMAALNNLSGVTVSPSPPASPFTGQAWFNTTAGVQQLYVWTGAAWTQSTNLTAYAPLASPAFSGVPTVPTAVAGTANNQAASTGFVAGNFLPLVGGRVTGTGGPGLAVGPTAMPSNAFAGTILTGSLTLDPTLPNGNNIVSNAYWDGANWRALNTGVSGIIGLTGNNLSYVTAASVAAGSVVAFNTLVFQVTTGPSGGLVAAGTFQALATGGGLTLPGTQTYISSDASQMMIGSGASTFNFVNASAVTGLIINASSIGGINYTGMNGQPPNQPGIAFFWLAPNLGVYAAGTWVGNVAPAMSDSRLKSNIGPIAVDCLATVNQISLQQFDLTMPSPADFPAMPRRFSAGFMSTQLNTLIPEAVFDGDGERTYDTLDLMPLVAYLVGAVQQISARLQALDGKAA